MILHTIVPLEEIFDEPGTQEMLEITRGEMRLIVTPTGNARGRVVQVISSDPADYLIAQYQPGLEIDLLAADFRDIPDKAGEDE